MCVRGGVAGGWGHDEPEHNTERWTSTRNSYMKRTKLQQQRSVHMAWAHAIRLYCMLHNRGTRKSDRTFRVPDCILFVQCNQTRPQVHNYRTTRAPRAYCALCGALITLLRAHRPHSSVPYTVRSVDVCGCEARAKAPAQASIPHVCVVFLCSMRHTPSPLGSPSRSVPGSPPAVTDTTADFNPAESGSAIDTSPNTATGVPPST